jgi:hypothetical protein
VFSSPLVLKFQCSQESSCPICARSDLNWHNYALRRLCRRRDSAAPSHFNGYALCTFFIHFNNGIRLSIPPDTRFFQRKSFCSAYTPL